MKRLIFSLLLLATMIWSAGCSKIFNDDGPETKITQQNGRTIIVDTTGKEWDITHALKNYGMHADRFQFGLGPGTIPPILNPEFLNPGDPGYPSEFATFLVIGAQLNGATRAYPISVLNNHEVIDELFGSTFAAVAY